MSPEIKKYSQLPKVEKTAIGDYLDGGDITLGELFQEGGLWQKSGSRVAWLILARYATEEQKQQARVSSDIFWLHGANHPAGWGPNTKAEKREVRGGGGHQKHRGQGSQVNHGPALMGFLKSLERAGGREIRRR